KIGEFKSSVKDFDNKISEGWHETNDVTAGIIERNTKFPNVENFEMIYSGPHIFVGNPLYKTPREKCVEKADYDIIDFYKIDENFVARTNYVPQTVTAGYASIIKGFHLSDGTFDNWLDYYKFAFRKMLSQASERTLTGPLIPPKSSHIHGIISIIFKTLNASLEFSGLSSSLAYDFYIKTIGASNLADSRIQSFPLGISDKYKSCLFVRTLLLNCLNKYYAPLWEEMYDEAYKKDVWSIADERLKPFHTLTKEWTWDTPLRNYFERRMALVEIDIITAMALGLTLEELILMYNIQFPVLQQNEDDTWYDAKGNIVFTCSK